MGKDEEISKPHQKTPSGFRLFQFQYLLVYGLTAFADWLQGTHMYQLYDGYSQASEGATPHENPYHPSHLGKATISALFITGFACSGIFGTVVGSFVDVYGRKSGVVLFCLLEIAINMMEEVEDLRVLVFGRVLGGISTSLMATAFESWMVAEHRKRKFPEDLMSQTFAYGQVINGVVAVIAGLVADEAVSAYGNIGPFRLAVVLSALVLAYVLVVWPENKGSSGQSVSQLFPNAWNMIWSEPRIMLVGFTQAFFEGAMFTFVFNWVPAMIHVYPWPNIAVGALFSTFMVCIAIGGTVYNAATTYGYPVEKCSLVIFVTAAVALSLPAIAPNSFPAVYGGFLLFETCVGASFACGGALRSKVMPEALQATIMNIFRFPLNILVIIGTSLDSWANTSQKFWVCVQWLVFAVVLQCVFVAMPPSRLPGGADKKAQ
eukprot:m.264415 g.264415  ORF g.264415 m.264415 type:complete len:433 (+) comp56133_c0_seq1:276-1574(+)